MMPTQCSLSSNLALLVLLGTVRAGPFSPRSNVTRPAPRPPPQPGGRSTGPGAGNPSARLYEHTVEGGEKQVVFTHRINLPPSAGCGCPPGTEPPAPASEVQSLRVRLEILEELVRGLKEQCAGGCCPAAAQAGTGQTDTRSLCSLHGVFDLSRCACSCEPGWGGPTCSDPADVPAAPSSPPTCPDDCNDQGRCVRGRCECFPGYTGPSCGWPSCPGDCSGRGRCVQGVCVCRPGFSGADCGERACPRGCNQRGRCEDGRCVCDAGYTGADCGERACPRGCSQRGRCVDGRCVCNPGYAGDDCAARSCPRGCSQRGRCVDGRCVCDAGYTGDDCGERACPGDCGEGGRCVDGRCVCWPGYAGPDCRTRTCPRDCHGRGRCEDGECLCDAGYGGDDCGLRACPGDCSQRGRCEDGVCVCWPGYAGPDCATRSCPRNCRGRGRCEAGVCVCQAGYSGEDCGLRACPGDCRGRGRCEAGRCVCWPGYSGRDCGVRTCPGDCRGRGRCEDGVCVCDPGFAGEDCGSRRCPGDCQGRGRCEDGVCVCHAGYTGEDCGARACPGGCRGRGQCLDGRCVCDEGYVGEDCGVRRCPRDCSQRGVCRDGVCVCWDGYAGEDCGLRTCPSGCHGRGRCEDGRCVCHPGYTGPSCAVRACPADCRGRGRCVQGTCVCHAGFSGPDCGQEEPPPSACPGGCGPRELCRGGQCVCVEGFRGPDCAIQTCPGDCLGRGECREGSCVCQDGYAGEDCSEEIPAIENMRMHLLEETTLRTEWTRGPGIVDAYEIQFIPTTEGASPPFTARVPGSASAYDQRGLAPGQEYQVTVRALRGTNWGPPATKTITTMIDGPQDLRVVAVTPTTLDLSWLRPQAAVDRFVVSYVSAGNQRVRLEVPPEADRVLLTDLMPGVEYVVSVTAERGPAVSYPASIRANTAPGHYSYPEVRPAPPLPQPRPRPQPAPPLLPPRPSRPAEEGGQGLPSPPQPPRRPWGNLTAELGRFRGSVQDLERLLRARGHPLRANQTYPALARQLFEHLLRRGPAAPAPPPHRSPSSSPAAGNRKRDSALGSLDTGAGSRHPKPEVLGFSADGTLLVSLDGLRGHFERVVLRWRPELPAQGPGGELTVPGSSRTASLPGLKPSTTYHVEVHGVRAGQTSKSYAFITTTGSSPPGFLGATDEPPPSGPSTTQGAQAPTLQHRPQELGELRVLGRDITGRLHVAWTAQPDTFAHFQLTLRVPEGPWVHEELLPGNAHEALVPAPPPGVAYELTLRGVPSNGEPSAPLTYHGNKERDREKTPRLGELTMTDATSNSLVLHWTVPEGEFDSFLIQYKDRDGPQVLPVEGSQREALITNLELGRKYKFVLYGMVGKKKHGPLMAEAKIVSQTDSTSKASPRLGKLWVTDPTEDSLHLSWTVPEGHFDSFLVQYKDKDGRPQVIPVEGPERSSIISQLAPGHTYRFTLFGIAKGKRHGPLTAEGTTASHMTVETRSPTEPPSTEATEVPEEPLLGELTVTDTTPDSLSLSWTVPQGHFERFLIQYKNGDGKPKVVRVPGHQDWVTISGLEPDHKYKMNLYGFHNGQRVGPISAIGVTDAEEETPTEMEVAPSPTEPASTEAPEGPEEPLLGELTVTDTTPDSLSLSWTVPQGHFERFLIQYKSGDGQPKVVRVPGHQDWATISDLEPDHKYKMNLYGFHNGQRVGPISAIGVTDAVEEPPSPTEAASTEAPETPEEPILGELTVTGSSQDSLSLSWTVPRGHFESFTIQYKDRDGRPQVVRVGGEESEVTVRGLDAGRKYKMHLYGLHGGQRVGPVSTVGITEYESSPITTPPLEPQLGQLSVTAVTPSSVDLAWTVTQGEFDSFVVQYKGKDGQPQTISVPKDQLEATIPDLEPAHKYRMNLYGLQNGQHMGPLSVDALTAPLPTVPATEPPKKPQLGDLTVTGVTPDSVGLTWTIPEGEFDSFMVQYKDREGQPQVVPVAADQRELTVLGLEPSRKYKFLLFGIQDGKRSSPVSVEAKTAASPGTTSRLGDLWVTDPTPDSLHLSWTVPEGHFDSFVVQFKDREGSRQVPVEGHERSVTITPLDANRKYRFLLYGLLGKKRYGPLTAEGTTENLSSQDNTGTKRLPKPRLGEELQVTSVTSDSVGLSWAVTEGHFDSFVVQYKDKDGQPQVVPVEGSLREVSVQGLDAGRRYKLLLYGLHQGKRVGPLSAIAVTERTEEEIETATLTPSTPALEVHLGELTVVEATPHTLHLSWTDTEGEFDFFEVQYTDLTGEQVLNVGGDQNDITLYGLESDHRYLISLYGFRGQQRVGPAQVEASTGSREEEDEPSEPPTISSEPPFKPHLGELTVTDTTPDSLSLSWTVPQGHFERFLVQYKNGDGQPKAVQVPGHQDWVTISDLEPDHKYKMNLYGFHNGQRVGPISAIGVTDAEEETPTEMEVAPSPTEPASTEAPEGPEEPLLGELTVTDTTPDSLSLSWTVPQGHFERFLIQYKSGDGQPKVVRVPGHQDWATISDLEPDHKYKMNLYGFHNGQRVGPISAIGVTDAVEEPPSPTEAASTEAPETPEEPILGELTVTGSSQDSLSLSWTVPQGHFESFTIQYKDRDGRPQVVRVGGEESEVTVRGLDAGRKYKMHLYGLHGGQRVGPVSTVGITDPEGEHTDPPLNPLLGELTVTDTTPDSLSLSWTVPQGHFDHFLVQYKNGDGQPKVVRVPGHQDWVTISGLEPYHKYKVNLYGLHGDQREGPVSTVGVTGKDGEMTPESTDEPTMTTTSEPPFKPQLGKLTVTDTTPDSLSLSWTVPQGHFERFLIQYKNGDGQPKVVQVPGHQDWVTISGLEPDHKYKMNLYGFHNGQRVGPISAIGVTDAEEETPTEVEVAPSPTEPASTAALEEPLLGELTVTDTTPDSLSLSWTVPRGHFERFLIQYKSGDGQPKVVRVPGHQDWATISDLEPDHKYKMNLYGFHNGQRVGPISAIGVTDAVEEPPSPTEAASTEAPETPEEPILGELTVTGSSQDSLSLSWTVPQGHFESFTIQYKDRDGRPQVVRVGGEESEVTVRGLDAGRKYKMHLYGLHGGQRVGPVSTVGITDDAHDSVEVSPSPTEPASTEAPKGPEEPLLGELTVTDTTPDSLSLSWTVPQGHFERFLIQYKSGDGQPKVVRVPGHQDWATISDLEPDHKYKMNLYGFHNGQRVGPISAIGVTDAVEEPPSPTEAASTEAPETPEEPILGELTVTGSSQDSLSLSWTVPRGHFESFTIQYKDRDGRPQVVRVGGEESEVTVRGLDAGRKYKMHLYGLHGGQRVGPVSTVGITDYEADTTQVPPITTTEPPFKPQLGELTVTGTTPDSLSLSWTVPQGHFERFLVQYKNGDGQPKAVQVPGHQDWVTISGLEPDHKYKMNLYGFHSGQRVGPISAIGVTDAEEETPTEVEVAPSPTEPASTEALEEPLLGELTVTDTTPDSLSLSWTVPRGHFERFLIQYKSGDGQPKAVRVPGHQDWVTISDLEPDHKYKMNLYGFHNGQRVGPISATGVTDAVEEPPSPTEAASTEAPETPEEPILGELTVTGSSQDSLSLSWTVPRGHFESFTIQYKDRDGRPQVVRVGGEESEVTVRGLDAGRKYKMHLYGLHGGQRVGPVSTVGITASLPTEAPVALSLGELAVTSATSDTVHLSWSVAQGPFDSFLVQYRDAQGQPQAVPVDGGALEVTVSGLDPARKYKFLLFGLQDGKKYGPVSTEAKTLPDRKPSPRLGYLTVTDVTTDSVGLEWTVPEGEFDSFVVQYKDREGQPQVVPVAADQRQLTIPGLDPNRKYKFLLYGLAGRKRLGPVSAEGTTAPLKKEPLPLPRLGELTLAEETPNSIQLSWTVAQDPFDSFMIQYRGTDGQPQTVPVDADKREVTIEGLEAGKRYKFLLYGLFRGQRLGPVSVLGTTAPAEDTPTPGLPVTEAPEGPRLGVLTVSSVAPDALRLSWSVARGPFESFVVQYRDPDGKPQALLVDGDQSTILVSNLEPGTPYTFSLYGLHEGKRLGPLSAEGTTGPAPPAGEDLGEARPRLSQLSVTDVTTSSLRLTWEAPPDGFDSFLLRYGVPSQSSLEPYPRPLLQRELTVPGSQRTTVLRGLRSGTPYLLTLYGLRGPHKADSIQGSARTLNPVLESPRDLQFSEIGETSAKVSWTPPLSRVDSFKVAYQLADGGEPQSVQVDGRAQTQTLRGLTPGTRYEVTVVSIRGFEESEPLTGFFNTVSDGPTKLQALNLTEGSTVLHWQPPKNPVDMYNVTVTAPEVPSLQGSAPGSAVDYPLTGLELHTNYTATVTGLRGSNFTSPANITFTTGLEPPRDFQAKKVTPRTALLTWTEPPDPPTGYLISFNTPGEQTQELLLPGGVTSHRLRGLFPSTPYNAWLRAVWGESFSPPMSTSFTTGGLRIPFPRDCGEEMQNGVSTSRTTTIFLNGNRERPLDVFCDMETDGGGWLVFQRRMDGKTDFWRDWEDYAHGFGNISREFWLGNEALHSLTSAGDYSMRVDLRAGDEAVFAHYDSFRVDSAAKYYRLHLEGYHGTAGDSMSYHSGSVFSARDRDPNNLLISCAVSYRGAWWYRNCHYANLNGLYGSTVDHQGVSWYYWKGFEFSVPFTEMKLRPRNYQPPARRG